MSDLTFNKVAGALLATGLVVVGLREASAVVFAPQAPETPGYAIAIPEDTGGAPVEEAPIDWGTVLPIADLAAGEASFAKCISCHTIAQGGANGTGPNLWGIIGLAPAAHAGYSYSGAFTEYAAAHPVWTHEEMGAFLYAPQRHISGTKMTFVGLRREEELINMVAYLHSMGGSLPFPAPAPAAAPVAEAEAPAEGEAAPAAEGGAPAETPAETAAPAAT